MNEMTRYEAFKDVHTVESPTVGKIILGASLALLVMLSPLSVVYHSFPHSTDSMYITSRARTA